MDIEPTAAADIVRRLDLSPHPEGGHYRQGYRAAETIDAAGLPPRYGAPRPHATAIYFLLAGTDVSHLHRLKSDELWHFYDGVPLLVHMLLPDGDYRCRRLGRDLAAGERPQLAVPAGVWFGAELADPRGYGLVGNTVAPGFDFADFELARAADLTAAFPRHAALIQRLSGR